MMTEQVVYELMMYCNCIFAVFLFFDLFRALFPLYENRRYVRLLEMMGCITAIFLINLAKNPLVNLICVPSLYFLYVWLVFRTRWKSSIVYVVLFYVIIAISEFAFLHIYKLLGVNMTRLGLPRFLLLITQDTFQFTIIQVVKKQLQIPYGEEGYHYTKYFLILPVASFVLLNSLLVPSVNPYGYLLIVAGSILLILSNIVIFITMERLLSAQRTMKDREMMVMKTKLEENHYRRTKEIEQNYEEYICGTIHILEAVASEERENIARFAYEAVRLLEKRPLVQPEPLNDAVLSEIIANRSMMARKLGVKYQLDIQTAVEIEFICEEDKIQMFGNLLDNALEAAASCENGYVSASLYRGNESIVIFRVENSFKQDRKKSRIFLTQKQDETGKGIWIDKVEELSHKYNGLLKITKNEQCSLAILVLSCIKDIKNHN